MQTLDRQLDDFAGALDEPEPEQLSLYAVPDARALPMPPEIAKAIVAVKKQVKLLPKDDENRFGKFKFTSVDTFYEAVGPIMAEAGLLLVCNEAEVSTIQRPTSTWLVIRYELALYHESGASFGPIHRNMMVAATGPQAFGAAESYVEKYYLRGLFKIPTGEQDADAEAQDTLPARKPTKHVGAFSKDQAPPPEPQPYHRAPTRQRRQTAAPAQTAPNGAQQQRTSAVTAMGLLPEAVEEPAAPKGLLATAEAKAAGGWIMLRGWYETLGNEDRLLLRPSIKDLQGKARDADLAHMENQE